MLPQFLNYFFKPPTKPTKKVVLVDDYNLVINLLKEINKIDLADLERSETWCSQKKMIEEARKKIEEATDLLEAAARAPSNFVW